MVAPKAQRSNTISPSTITRTTSESVARGGPVAITRWHGEGGDEGVHGEAKLATAEKGRIIFEEAVKRLVEFADEFHARPKPVRRAHHDSERLSELPG